MAVKEKKTIKKSPVKASKPKTLDNKLATVLYSIKDYFVGSWAELRQVRWPDRKSAWGMTAAVLLFTGAFLALIVTLDAIFNQLFKLIIK